MTLETELLIAAATLAKELREDMTRDPDEWMEENQPTALDIELLVGLIEEQQASIRNLQERLNLARAARDSLIADQMARLAQQDPMRMALLDCAAILEHYVERRPMNWDGSTESQARAALVNARQVLAKVIA